MSFKVSLCGSGFPCQGLKRILLALKKQIWPDWTALWVVQPCLSPGWSRADPVTVPTLQGGVGTGPQISPHRAVPIQGLLHTKHSMQEAASTWTKIQEGAGGRESTWQGARSNWGQEGAGNQTHPPSLSVSHTQPDTPSATRMFHPQIRQCPFMAIFG